MVHYGSDTRYREVLDKVSWSVADVELFEINEAFAVAPMAAAAIWEFLVGN